MSYKVLKDKIYSEVSCENAKHRELGIDNQKWIPCGFRLKNISGWKEYQGDEDDPERGMTTIYVDGIEYIIQVPYNIFDKIMREEE